MESGRKNCVQPSRPVFKHGQEEAARRVHACPRTSGSTQLCRCCGGIVTVRIGARQWRTVHVPSPVPMWTMAKLPSFSCSGSLAWAKVGIATSLKVKGPVIVPAVPCSIRELVPHCLSVQLFVIADAKTAEGEGRGGEGGCQECKRMSHGPRRHRAVRHCCPIHRPSSSQSRATRCWREL